MKSSVFWDIMLCTLWKVNRHFRGTCHLYLQGWRISQTRKQPESRWQVELSPDYTWHHVPEASPLLLIIVLDFSVVCILTFGCTKLIKCNRPPYSIHQILAWEANSHSLAREFSAIYTIYCFITMFTRAPLDSILSQTNAVHILPPYFFKINFNIILPPMPKSPMR
jgi:hypothetical protein